MAQVKAGTEKCIVCQKTVFAMEKISVDGHPFHEGCFKCAQCKKKLTPGNFSALEGTYYCKPHYTQLFKSKGNYSEGFGKEKPTAAWAPLTGGYEGTDKPSAPKDTKETTAPAPPGPPGPPPPQPPPDFGNQSSTPSGGSNAHADALAAIASGGPKLKHVSREDRKRKPESSYVPDKPKVEKESTAPKSDGVTVKTGTPELKLDNGKWTARFFTNRKEEPVEITIADIKQSVVVTDCKNAIFIVKGKLTNISVMNSESVAVIFDDIIATTEVTRCKKIQLQANGKIAQIAIDKSTDCDVFIQSDAGKDVEIVTSLTYAINVNFPGATPDDDPLEFPIPDQFESHIQKEKLITTPASHV